MTDESRHLWQRIAIIVCRAAAAVAFSVGLIRGADSLSDWKAVLGVALVTIVVFDLGSKLLGLRQERRSKQ